MRLKRFKVQVKGKTLKDLKKRLENTRWPDEVEGANWDYGTNQDYLKNLVRYWIDNYDWQIHEDAMNRFSHYRTEVDGLGIHFIHERGKGKNPIPILLSHGFPDSFLRMSKIIPLLTDPDAHGADPNDSFDVIVPSLPGFGFSDRPKQRGFTVKNVADLLAKLMTDKLRYKKFAAHGGDWGSSITEQIALNHSDSIIGIHMTDVPFWHLFSIPTQQLSEAESKYLQAGQHWRMAEGGYAMIQSTKPQTLAYGLNDSPAGLAGWIVEKFRSWSDCNGNVETRFTKDEILTTVTLYWATETINSAFRYYYESLHIPRTHDGRRVEVPTGVALFPKDLILAPREFGERFFNIQRWTEMPRGGHFAAFEEPELLATELREFFRPLRRDR